MYDFEKLALADSCRWVRLLRYSHLTHSHFISKIEIITVQGLDWWDLGFTLITRPKIVSKVPSRSSIVSLPEPKDATTELGRGQAAGSPGRSGVVIRDSPDARTADGGDFPKNQNRIIRIIRINSFYIKLKIWNNLKEKETVISRK